MGEQIGYGAQVALSDVPGLAWLTEPPEHVLYLVSAPAVGAVKIGHASAIVQRLANLRCGSPVRLQLAAGWGMSRVAAVRMEAEAHQLLSWARSHGEWFNVSETGAVQVIEALEAGRRELAADISRFCQSQSNIARQRLECEAALNTRVSRADRRCLRETLETLQEEADEVNGHIEDLWMEAIQRPAN